MEEFKSGDLVRLKSGGPTMVASGKSSHDANLLLCTWFNFNGTNNYTRMIDHFTPATLEKAE